MQSTSRVLMVRPANFGFNEESAENNAFMTRAKVLSPGQIVERAKREFDDLVNALLAIGTDVTVVEDTPLPRKPDAVFPNNWFSTHENGTVITYPMYAVSRRIERINPVLATLNDRFVVENRIHFEQFELENTFLEGTGSLLLDRINKVVYACTSDRTDEALTRDWAAQMGYETAVFKAVDNAGLPIYHTNVIMAMGTHHTIICMESVVPEDREALTKALQESGRKIIEISFDQVKHYSGNMLEVLDGQEQPHWVMSTQARTALTAAQKAALEEYQPIVHADIEAIETLGGGSARCMIAEIFLKEK